MPLLLVWFLGNRWSPPQSQIKEGNEMVSVPLIIVLLCMRHYFQHISYTAWKSSIITVDEQSDEAQWHTCCFCYITLKSTGWEINPHVSAVSRFISFLNWFQCRSQELPLWYKPEANIIGTIWALSANTPGSQTRTARHTNAGCGWILIEAIKMWHRTSSSQA